ncbi:hypothetical protein TRVL_07202 [Trypanosoma vivax]|nr:hypothetical protein TRVL_07202 [Trypanosoma vivax]
MPVLCVVCQEKFFAPQFKMSLYSSLTLHFHFFEIYFFLWHANELLKASTRKKNSHAGVTMGHLDQWRSRQKIGMGKGARHCVICSNQKALIRKYELNVCRQCFRENAEHIGFVKLR